MRIGIDARTLSYEYTGIPIFLHDVLMYWNENNTEDDYFLFSNRKFTLDFELKNNWHVIIDKKPFGSIWEQIFVPHLLQKYNIDVFWEPMHFLPRHISNVKYIMTVHDLAVYQFPQYGAFSDTLLEHFLLPISCRRADKIIAVSKSTKKDIINFFGVEDNKISVIYNGDSSYLNKVNTYSDTEEQEILDKWRLTKKNFLLFVGTIEPRKNIITIVKSFEVLKEKGKYDGKLVIVGKTGWKYKKIFKQIYHSRFIEDILITGYVTNREKECLYRNALCFLYPSLYEGFGFPIIEAMSVGLPVITSNISSMPEVGGDVAKYLEESKLTDINSLCGIIEEVINYDEQDYEKIRTNSVIQASKFSRKQCADKIRIEIGKVKNEEISDSIKLS